MPRRKLVVHRNEWGGLRLPEGANERMDEFQRDIVSFRQWLLERDLTLDPVVFTIQKKM